MAFDGSGLTSEELVRATWLRSVEWSKWPIFISQPLLPILLLWCRPVVIGAWILALAYLWIPIRSKFVSFKLATAGAFWVRLKWPVVLIMTVYFGLHHNWKLTLLSLFSPVVVLLVSALVVPGKIGLLQRQMYRELDFDPEEVQLNSLMDEMKLATRRRTVS